MPNSQDNVTNREEEKSNREEEKSNIFYLFISIH